MPLPVYPNGVVTWTNRIDFVNTVWANDPNTLAAEIQAIEATVGTTPQNESDPPVAVPGTVIPLSGIIPGSGSTASAVPYPTVSARISAAMNGSLLPWTYMRNDPGFYMSAGKQVYNTYNTVKDDYNIWNGQDATIPCSGYWSVSAKQKWSQQGSKFNGYSALFLYVNGHNDGLDMWNWTSQFANSSFHYPDNVLFGQGWTQIHWEGLLAKNDRVKVLSVNATNCANIQITVMTFHAMCHRTVDFNFVGPG